MILEFENLTKEKVNSDFFKEIAQITLEEAGLKKTDKTEINLVLVEDEKIRELNKKYRNQDKVTDVLSFTQPDDFIQPPDQINRLGEVFICLSQAQKQSQDLKINVRQELARLFIHGILHLMNYDHEEGSAAEVMRQLEEKILKKVNTK